jgi:hypothetical protein
MAARLISLACVVLTGVLAAPALGARSAAGPCASGSTASTASYRLALAIGPQEDMYLPSEVKARHIKTGEIMLGGDMTMADKTPGTKVFHLEVHICTPSGAVVKGLKPVITVQSAGAKAVALPAAIMVGIGAPSSDYHYGNDIALKPGAAVTVKVAIKGQTAVLHGTTPK